MKMSPHFKRVFVPLHLLGIYAVAKLFHEGLHAGVVIPFFTGWILIAGYGVAVGFHRLLSHHAFETPLVIERALSYLGCLGAQGSPLFWTAVHRGSHHPYSDTERDMHSPLAGKFHAYIGWQIYLDPTKVSFRAAKDLMKDPFQMFLHKNYMKIYWGTFLALLILSPTWAWFGMILPSIVSVHTENSVDLFCHWPSMGYRHFDTNDLSVNVPLLGWFGFGQGWHNNHHAHPARGDFGSERFWEIDPSVFLIALIRKSRPVESLQTIES